MLVPKSPQIPINNLVATDQQLQAFLTWVSQKSRAVPTSYKSVTVRAFYFDLVLARALGRVGGTLDLARAFNPTFTCNLERHLALDLALDRTLGLDQVVALTAKPNLVFERVLERALTHARLLDPMLEQALLKLKEQMPDKALDRKRFKQWWSAHGGAWTEQLRAVTIKYCNLGHNWQFSEKQREALKHYKDANLILVNYYLNCYMTLTVRSEIEQTLLLPIVQMCGVF